MTRGCYSNASPSSQLPALCLWCQRHHRLAAALSFSQGCGCAAWSHPRWLFRGSSVREQGPSSCLCVPLSGREGGSSPGPVCCEAQGGGVPGAGPRLRELASNHAGPEPGAVPASASPPVWGKARECGFCLPSDFSVFSQNLTCAGSQGERPALQPRRANVAMFVLPLSQPQRSVRGQRLELCSVQAPFRRVPSCPAASGSLPPPSWAIHFESSILPWGFSPHPLPSPVIWPDPSATTLSPCLVLQCLGSLTPT